MATSQDIAINAQYRGDNNLGGGNFGVITADTKPLENLAFYTMSYNKAKWDQKQKETDAKVKEIADLSNISLNDLRGKDKEQATKEFSTLLKQASDYARKTPKTPQQKIEDELEWQTQLGAFKNNYGSGKTRAVAYQAQLGKINSEITDAKQKEIAINSLNKKFDSTDIGTPISAMEEFKLDKIDVPKPNTQTFDTIGIGKNEDVVTTAAIFNPTANLPSADAAVLGIKKTYKKGTPEYEGLSDLEQQQADQQNASTSTGKLWADMAEPFNAVRKNYVNAEGVFDAEKFEEENAANATIMNAYNAMKNVSNYSTTKKQETQAGQFNDKGLSFKIPPNIKPTDFNPGIINFSKDVSPNQLVLAGMYSQYGGDKYEKKLMQTDNALQRDQNALAWAKLGLDKDEFGLKQKQFESSQKGTQTQVNGAMDRAKRIYGDMRKLADENGVIAPDKLRQLNVEQLKYLGIEQPEQRDDLGKTIVAGGFKPLELGGDKEFAIQLVDGNIKVLQPEGDNKKLTKLSDGRFVGAFDNTKSTTLFNVATNILNEELKNAGSKELNSYYGVDVTGDKTSFTDVQTSSTKSSNSAQTRKGKDGKVYTSTDGITWTSSDGTTVTLKKK